MTNKHFQTSKLLMSLLATVTTVRVVTAQDTRKRMPDQVEVQILLEDERILGRGVYRLGARAERRDRFESVLKSRVGRLRRQYGLSDAQQKKLLLAGRVDISRFFDRADELEKELSLVQNDRVERLRALKELTTLNRNPGHDLFGEHSLFLKVLGNALTKEQTASYQAVEREIASKRHRATLEWVLATWDHTLGLTAAQHQRLAALLSSETRPPRRFGAENYFGVMLQLSRLPEARIKTIVSNDQWVRLEREIAEARRREAMLKAEGYVPDEDVASAPPPRNAPSTKPEKKQG